jgi:hypothetical protein
MKDIFLIAIIVIFVSSVNGASIIDNYDDDEFNTYQHLYNLNDNSKVYLIKKKNNHVYFNQKNGKYFSLYSLKPRYNLDIEKKEDKYLIKILKFTRIYHPFPNC